VDARALGGGGRRRRGRRGVRPRRAPRALLLGLDRAARSRALRAARRAEREWRVALAGARADRVHRRGVARRARPATRSAGCRRSPPRR
jgi:hypothetical protein